MLFLYTFFLCKGCSSHSECHCLIHARFTTILDVIFALSGDTSQWVAVVMSYRCCIVLLVMENILESNEDNTVERGRGIW